MKYSLLLSVFLSALVFAQDEGVVTIDATVTGNQEQPKVLYIVPWKEADDNSILTQALDTKVENVFGHVERAEHLRKLEFIEVLDKKEE